MSNTQVENITQLIEADKKHFLHPASNIKQAATEGPSIIFESGKGIYVKNAIDGKDYIDAMSMLWNVNLGHGNEELVQAGAEQMSSIAFSSSFRGFSNIPAIKLAEKVAELAPGDLTQTFFTSGGSESNDTNIKLVRFYWQLKGKPSKHQIIAIKNAYHGVTVAAQTATHLKAFHEFADSQIGGVHHAQSYLLDAELGDKNAENYENSIRATIERVGAENVAGVLLEPIQGAGGVNVPPEGYLEAVRKLCDEYDILMMVDEVICGFGRTGKVFGVDNWDIVPDTLSFAKGVSSGYTQLGGVIVNEELSNTFKAYDGVLAHGFTYSAHPAACAVGLKNIEIIERDNIIDNVNARQVDLLKGLEYLQEKHKHVTNVRCVGLLAAFELREDTETGKLFDDKFLPATKLVDEAFKHQLIVRSMGVHNEIVAIAPPLTITKEEVAEIIEKLDISLTNLFA